MVKLSDIPNNNSVRWDGTRFGILPILSDDAEKIMNTGKAAVPALLHALDNPHLFVTAHVLLTKISALQYETFPSWNGLSVDIEADGSVNIPSDQRFVLESRWRKWYQASPRPQKLPDAD